MTDTTEEAISQHDTLVFLNTEHGLENLINTEDFVRNFNNVASHDRFSTIDAIDKFNLMFNWAILDNDKVPLGIHGEDKVRLFFQTYRLFLEDVLYQLDAAQELIDVESQAGDPEETIELKTDMAAINQRTARALFKAGLDSQESPESRSANLLHSLFVSFAKSESKLGKVALGLLDGARAQAGVMRVLYDYGYGQNMFIPEVGPTKEQTEELKRFDVMSGGDIILVSLDRKKVVLFDVKGRYFTDNSHNQKNNFVDVVEYPPPYYGMVQNKNENYMGNRLGNLSRDSKFIHVQIVIPTATEYLTPTGVLVSRSDQKTIIRFLDQYNLK